MSKYAPLTDFLNTQKSTECQVSFRDLEKLLGFALPRSAKAHRAWWSNNPDNNVMTRAWLAAGWEARAVDMEAERLTFVQKVGAPTAETGDKGELASRSGPVNIFGVLKGTVTILGNILEPLDIEWNAEKGVL